MFVVVILLVLIIMIVSLLIFANIINQKKSNSHERKIEYFRGYPTTGVTYPRPRPDTEKTLEELENEMLHLWADGYLPNQKTQDDVLKYAYQYYTSQHTSQ